MFPLQLATEEEEDIPEDYKFNRELLQFRAPQAKFERRTKEAKSGSNTVKNAQKMNSGYTSKSGHTYGLYPRFFWDVANVPFGGMPNIKSDPTGFCANLAVSRSPPAKGGKIHPVKPDRSIKIEEMLSNKHSNKIDSLEQTGFRFNRAARVLISEEAAKNVNQPNSLLYKDKNGKRVKTIIKGPTFSEAQTDKNDINKDPGPGAYDLTMAMQISTLGGERAPAYSMNISGLVKMSNDK